MKRAAAALAGAIGTVVASQALSRTGRAERPAWVRTNFRDRQVSLAGGVATAVGATAVAATLPGRRAKVGGMLAVAGSAAFGLVDDQASDPAAARGLRGHLRALARGRFTTGTLKLLGIPAISMVAAACLSEGMTRTANIGRQQLHLFDLVSSAALIAGTANLVNLFDLRPGRALKASLLPAAGLAATRPAAAVGAGTVGVVAAAWPAELGERAMLGDTGANALGALLGTGMVLVPGRKIRLAGLAGVTCLIVVSERVSFSAVIDAHAVLRKIDAWGRRQ